MEGAGWSLEIEWGGCSTKDRVWSLEGGVGGTEDGVRSREEAIWSLVDVVQNLENGVERTDDGVQSRDRALWIVEGKPRDCGWRVGQEGECGVWRWECQTLKVDYGVQRTEFEAEGWIVGPRGE